MLMVHSLMSRRDYICLCNLIYLLAFGVRLAVGGVCWESFDMTTKLCKKALRLNMSHTECCQLTGVASLSWTPHEKASDIFYLNYLAAGADICQRCHHNCSTVDCGRGQTCRMINGLPECKCKPHCDRKLKSRGRLCGTDGRKYRNYCALERYNCANEREIYVDYFGKCRKSCKRVKCENGKRCLQDQNGMPHCIYCDVNCDHTTGLIPNDPSLYMCGENGRTYRTSCELKADVCREGKTIRIAHFGKCYAYETCSSFKCPEGTKCLVSVHNRRPICMNCDMNCVQSVSVPVCGNDRKTYPSYCHMLDAGCRAGVYVSTKRGGRCKHNKDRKYQKGLKGKGKLKRIGTDNNIDTIELTETKRSKQKHRAVCRRKECRKIRRKFQDKQMWQAYKSANLIALSESSAKQFKSRKTSNKEGNTS